MRFPIHSPRLAAASDGFAGVLSVPTEQSASPSMAATDLVYDLRLGTASSDDYYEEIARFSDAITAEIERQAGTVVDGYRNHILDFLREGERSRGEYARSEEHT